MTGKQPSAALRDLFSGSAENTFQVRLGVADPPLIDYVSELLVRFLRQESVYKVRNARGKPLHSVFEMLGEAGRRMGQAQREVHRHIGDFALFWAGLYPEALRGKQADGDEVFHQYCMHGKRSYRIASTIHPSDENAPSGDVLERLSEEFELCAYGLREVRREFERSDDGGTNVLPVIFD
jgi:hypothetical protein